MRLRSYALYIFCATQQKQTDRLPSMAASPTPLPHTHTPSHSQQHFNDDALHRLFDNQASVEAPPIYAYPGAILEQVSDKTRIPAYRYFSQRADGSTCKIGVLHRVHCDSSGPTARCEGRLYERGHTTCMDADSKIVMEIENGKIHHMELHPNLSTRNLDKYLEAHDGEVALPDGAKVKGKPVDNLRLLFPHNTYNSGGIYRLRNGLKDVAYATHMTCAENYELEGETQCSGKLTHFRHQQPTADVRLTLGREYLKNKRRCRNAHFNEVLCFETRDHGADDWTSSGPKC